MKKKVSLLLCAAMAVTLLGGCGGNSGTAEPSKGESKPAAASQDGKVMTFAIRQEPETLDPTLNNYTASSIVLQNLFLGLYQLDAEGQLAPGCAESYTVSDDGLEYTFKLKADLKWSDGTALTAKDFEYAWKRVLNPDTASPASWNFYVVKNGEAYNTGAANVDEVGIIATDDTTLKVTLENPTAYFIYLTTGSDYFPVKKDVVEGADVWTKSADTYVCNGAFMIQEINPQASYELVKNPSYAYADTVKLDGLNMV